MITHLWKDGDHEVDIVDRYELSVGSLVTRLAPGDGNVLV